MLILSAAGCNFTSDVDAETHIHRARAFLEEGRESAAVIELKNALQKDSRQAEARWLLGRLYLKYGNGEAAEKEFDQATTLGFEHPELQISLLRAKLLQGHYQEIIDQTATQAARQDTPAEIHAIRGDAYLGLQEFDKALASYERASSADPESISALLGRARVAAVRNDLETAHRLIRHAEQIAPERAEVWLLKGQIALFENRPDMAEQAFAEATRLADYNLMGPLGLIQALFMQNKFEAALKPIETIEARNSKHPLTRFYRAVIALQSNKLEEAKDYLRQALQLAPDHAQSKLLLARILYEEGQMEQARQQLNSFLRQQPDHPLGNRLMAAVQMQLNETEQAIQRLENLKDKDASVMSMLSNMYAQTGQMEMGEAALENALKLNPRDPALQTQLALYKLNTGDVDQAISGLETVNRDFPDYGPAYMALITLHLRAEQPGRAIETARMFVKNNPDDPQAYNMLGITHLANGDAGAARENYNKALAIDPDHIPALTSLARLELQSGNNEAAGDYFQKIYQLDSTNLPALLYLARRAAENNDHKQTLALLRQAIETHPQAVLPRIYLGRYHLANQEYTAMEEVMNAAHKLEPDNPDVLLLLGQAQRFNGKLRDSLATFEKLVELRPDEAVGHYQLALSQLSLGNREAAEQGLNKALELNPDFAEALSAAARLALQQGDRERAKQYTERLGKLDSESAQVTANILDGDISAADNRPEDAIAAYEKALSRSQSDFGILTRMASLYESMNRPEKSIQLLDDWLRNNPDHKQAKLLLAQTYHRIGQLPEAKQQYKSVLEMDPDNLVALNNLAWIYIEEDTDLALDLAQQAHELAPESADVLDTLAWALIKDNKVERGIRYLRSALEKSPDSPVIRYHYAYALAESGDDVLARNELEKLLAEHARFDERDDAVKLLTSLQ